MRTYVERCHGYDDLVIGRALEPWSDLFSTCIAKGSTVVLKPNWLAPSHTYDPTEWVSVITHPAVITGVLRHVLRCLEGNGRVVITDGPQTDSSWDRIMERMEPDRWVRMGRDSGIEVRVMDLREDEWVTSGDVKVQGRKLPGDPRGSTVCDLGTSSEFVSHAPSRSGYYGADYDKAETNRVHSGGRNMYKVSRTIIEADTFINLPKLKTHKKAGITCSLKNLVGINTYKNWLPHHNEGTPDRGGDQFPSSTPRTWIEGSLTEAFKGVLAKYPRMGRWMVPVKGVGRKVFGETRDTIRGGNWYGNDTLWRTVLDLNKVLLYARPDGSLRPEGLGYAKSYLSIVDGIVAGEGNGPEAPTPKATGVLIGGTNPVAVDMLCARLMSFDWEKIPALRNAFRITRYPLSDFQWDDLVAVSADPKFHKPISQIRPEDTFHFRPHFGWEGHIELTHTQVA